MQRLYSSKSRLCKDSLAIRTLTSWEGGPLLGEVLLVVTNKDSRILNMALHSRSFSEACSLRVKVFLNKRNNHNSSNPVNRRNSSISRDNSLHKYNFPNPVSHRIPWG